MPAGRSASRTRAQRPASAALSRKSPCCADSGWPDRAEPWARSGASEAVTAFLDRKALTSPSSKALGADGGLVFLIFFLQVMTIALAAVASGREQSAPRAPIPVSMLYGTACCRRRWALSCAAARGGVRPVVRASLRGARHWHARAPIPPASLLRDIVSPGATTRPRHWRICAAGMRAGRSHPRRLLLCARRRRFAGEFLAGARAVCVMLRRCA